MGINERNVKTNIKPTIWKNIANDNHQKPDVPDNFKKYKTKTIPKNIILSKSKYDLKIVFWSHFFILTRYSLELFSFYIDNHQNKDFIMYLLNYILMNMIML